MLRVSNSEVQTFKRCRRKWYLQYHEKWGLSPQTAPMTSAALLGTRVHTALEAYYGYGINPVAAAAFIYDAECARRPECASDLVAEQDWSTIMLAGFVEWAEESGIDEQYEVVATEQVLDAHLLLTSGEMAVIFGKMDQIVRRRVDGALMFRDFKTTGSLGKVNSLIRDEQFRTYAVIHRAVSDGMRVDGGLYLMLLRSKHTARASGPFYDEVAISYNGHEHASMLIRLRGVLDDMERVTRQLNAGIDHRLVAYPTPMQDRCDWDCPFSKVCPLFDDGSRAEAAMEGNFVKRNPYDYYEDSMIDRVREALA